MKTHTLIRALGAFTLLAGTVWAEVSSAQAVSFTPPNGDAPEQTVGGASRSGQLCPQAEVANVPTEDSLTALLPDSQYGTTHQERPTILVYLPETGVEEAVFALKDENKKLHYQMTVPLSGKAEIVSVELPENAPSLEPGQNYQWFFVLKCNGRLHPSNPMVEGWIERLETQGNAATPSAAPEELLKTATDLGAAGIWYDTVATLAMLRKTQPASREIDNHWQELLGSVGLEELTTAPLAASL